MEKEVEVVLLTAFHKNWDNYKDDEDGGFWANVCEFHTRSLGIPTDRLEVINNQNMLCGVDGCNHTAGSCVMFKQEDIQKSPWTSTFYEDGEDEDG